MEFYYWEESQHDSSNKVDEVSEVIKLASFYLNYTCFNLFIPHMHRFAFNYTTFGRRINPKWHAFHSGDRATCIIISLNFLTK